MTDEANPDRESPADPKMYYMTDAQIIARLGVPEKIAYSNFHEMDRHRMPGWPLKNPAWGNRRYWPKVRKFFDDLEDMASQGERRRAG